MSETPIYDALVIEHREANAAGDLAEGRGLVASIYARNGYVYPSRLAEERAALGAIPPAASIVKLIGGLFR